MGKPLFSIVYPTRNRPTLLKYCLSALLMQTYDDFEVIVSDNHTGLPCDGVFAAFSADHRFRYLAPPTPLAMHDNWEYALRHASGEYVTVLTDKTVLRPSALRIASAVVSQHTPQIMSWWEEGYSLSDETRGYDRGLYFPRYSRVHSPTLYDAKDEIKQRFAFDVRREMEGIHYYRGKICFGMYRRDLIDTLISRNGRLFFPLSPDYTSRVGALACAEKAVDMGEPLQIAFSGMRISTGGQSSSSADRLLAFYRACDPEMAVLQRLPFKGLYSSLHNAVAADYAYMKPLFPELDGMDLCMPNLLRRIREDLQMTSWEESGDRKEQMTLWTQYAKDLGIRTNVATMLSAFTSMATSRVVDTVRRHPTAFRLAARLRSFLGHAFLGERSIREFDSILDALPYAERHYATSMASVRQSSATERPSRT